MTAEQTQTKLDDIARLLAVLVRDAFETQAAAIEAMSKAGLQNNRIAELLGTTSATVRNAGHKEKKP